MMLTDEQKAVLCVRHPDWIIWGNATFDSTEGKMLRMAVAAWADTLLALKEAREVLKEIEWIEGMPEDEDKFCPECGDWEWRGHAKNCKLAKVLGEGE